MSSRNSVAIVSKKQGTQKGKPTGTTENLLATATGFGDRWSREVVKTSETIGQASAQQGVNQLSSVKPLLTANENKVIEAVLTKIGHGMAQSTVALTAIALGAVERFAQNCDKLNGYFKENPGLKEQYAEAMARYFVSLGQATGNTSSERTFQMMMTKVQERINSGEKTAAEVMADVMKGFTPALPSASASASASASGSASGSAPAGPSGSAFPRGAAANTQIHVFSEY